MSPSRKRLKMQADASNSAIRGASLLHKVSARQTERVKSVKTAALVLT
jgi:hypothetical protein